MAGERLQSPLPEQNMNGLSKEQRASSSRVFRNVQPDILDVSHDSPV